LKRFITDRSDPAMYKPASMASTTNGTARIAIVGSGPAGLTAAHFLSLKGYKVTVFETDDRPGGMLFSAIPSYRLPREVIQKEVESLLDENITLRCNTTLGRDITIDSLFADGFHAIFVAIGAHKACACICREKTCREFIRPFNFSRRLINAASNWPRDTSASSAAATPRWMRRAWRFASRR
jgi:NADPH-dependent glutamate synthase beta subunit-like oxidoreductase